MIQLALVLLAALSLVMTLPQAKADSGAVDKPETSKPAAVVGDAAPDFTGTDTQGKTRTLSGYLGKTVVLEWTNHECPFVRKHYDTGAMQALQKEATDKGVIWLTIVSSAAGKQGFTTPEEASAVIKKEKSRETARILDSKGAIGHLYGAETTPHMYIIDSSGTLVYAGGIDDQPSVSHATIKTAHNYVKEALDDIAAGRAVRTPNTRSYGCGVKY